MTAQRLWMLTAIALLVLLASLAAAALRLHWHAQGHTSLLPLTLVAAPEETAETMPRDTGAIIALAPFGQQPAPADAPSVPERTSLDVALRGVLVDPDPTQSRAFLVLDGKTSVFRLGDPVSTAELVAINTDTVTLNFRDALMIVGFDGMEGQDPQDPTSDPISGDTDTRDDPFARLAAAIVPGQGSIDLRDAPPPETTEDYIALWRDRITQNPQAAMDRVGIELVEQGYRVMEDPNIGVTLAGLRAGDVVTRLNGQALGDPDSDRVLYDEVAASGIARLEVVRDGKALLLTFPLR